MALLTSVGANLEDGLALAARPGAVIAGPGTVGSFQWKVVSSTGARRYTVSLLRSSLQLRHCTVFLVPQQIDCTCAGCLMLKKSKKDKICKHELAVLARCLQQHNQDMPTSIVRGNSAFRLEGVGPLSRSRTHPWVLALWSQTS